MCFLGGSGSLVQNTDMGAACNINPAGLRLTTQLPVLLAGAMASPDTAVEDVYTWAAAPKPGVPAFGLPHWNDVEVGKQMFVCLGSNSEIGSFSIVGSGHDGTCFGAYSGGTYTLSNVQWLVQLDGAPHWVQGNGKIIAGDVGTPPGPALTYAGALLCSQGGMVGFNYSNQCSISSYDPLMWLPADMKQQPGLGPTPFDIGGSTPAYVLSGRIL